MKYTIANALLLSCLLMAASVMAGLMETAHEVMTECLSENGVTEQEISHMKSGDMKLEEVKDNVKCASQCAFAKMGVMNSKGVLQQEKFLDHFKNEPYKAEAEKALNSCGKVSGDNPCDTAFQIMVCIGHHVKEVMNI